MHNDAQNNNPDDYACVDTEQLQPGYSSINTNQQGNRDTHAVSHTNTQSSCADSHNNGCHTSHACSDTNTFHPHGS